MGSLRPRCRPELPAGCRHQVSRLGKDGRGQAGRADVRVWEQGRGCQGPKIESRQEAKQAYDTVRGAGRRYELD